jgi:hypothetical protein
MEAAVKLVVTQNKDLAIYVQNDDWRYIHLIRQSGNIIRPDRIKVGGYYLYKEKHGMVCMVKILEDTSKEDWIGFRMMVKRVLYSCWHVPRNCVFEAGYHATQGYPKAWHLEPTLELLDKKAV